MKIGVPRETLDQERRVAVVPTVVSHLIKKGHVVVMEAGAGAQAGYPDEEYRKRKAELVSSRNEVFELAEVILQVNGLGGNPEAGKADLQLMRQGQTVIGMLDPLWKPVAMQDLAQTGVTSFALELLPRITRAQSMDTLSSMATVAGYKGVLIGADALHKMFPMLMTAAGSLAPAKVLVVGAGVAGLQAISTAKRLGAVVSGYDIRPAVKEQIESLGAKFVEMDLGAQDAETKGGYAKEQDDAVLQKQQELMARVVAESDMVVTTAAIPGRKSPVIVTAEMVAGMAPGSVIVDLAAERGGNCALTQPGKTVDAGGVKILGPLNLASTIPFHASQMYAKNISTFLDHLIHEGEMKLDMEDEITADTLITREGKVVNERVRAALGEGAASSSN